jgi:hypothetical protein
MFSNRLERWLPANGLHVLGLLAVNLIDVEAAFISIHFTPILSPPVTDIALPILPPLP